jgi:HlyD family secretion protein
VVTQRKQDVLLVPNAALRFTPPDVAAAGQDQRSRLFLPGITRGGPGGGRQQRQNGQTGGSQGQAGAARGSRSGADSAAGARGGARRGGANGTVWVLRQTAKGTPPAPVAVQVTTGATDGRNTEVSSPQLQAGDEVIVDVAVQEKKGTS